MPKYRYIGVGCDGQSTTGSIVAPTEFDAEIKALNKGISVSRIQPDFETWTKLYLKYFRQADVTRIARQLGLLLKSEISVHEALTLAKDQTSDAAIKRIFYTVIRQVESGKSVAESLRDFPFLFDPLFTGVVEAGEISGSLDQSFERIATFREKTEAIKKKVVSAMAYPLLVMGVAVLVIWGILYYVVPIFASMYAGMGAELPSMTKVIMNVSNTLKNTIWYVIGGSVVVLMMLAYAVSRRNMRVALGRMFYASPVIGKILATLASMRFSRTLGTLLTGGVDILRAVDIASKTTGLLYVEQSLSSISDTLSRGQTLTDSLAECRVFPLPLLRLTAVGERTGRLGEMLTRAAEYYESEAETQLSTLTSLIEPLLIIVLGLFIAVLLIAMYLPLFELVGQL